MSIEYVYSSEDDRALYLEDWIDVDPETKQAEGYRRYKVTNQPITLTPEQCCGHYGSMVEILLATGYLAKEN